MFKLDTIGIIGCGVMGKGLAVNLLRHHYDVYVYDTNAEALKYCSNQGATPVASLKEMAENTNMIVTSLPNPKIVKDILSGSSGLLPFMKKNSIILDMSTINPEAAIELADEANKFGVHFFDCPLSGGPDGAERGELTIMVGGEQSHLDRIMPVLNMMGKEIFYLGASGSGQIAKLCNNMVVASIMMSLGEAFIVSAKAGVAPTELAKVLSKGSANNRVLEVFGSNILNGTYDNVLFSLSNMHKDLSLYQMEASRNHVPSIISSLVYQMYEAALANGKGSLDASAVCNLMEELAGFKISREFNIQTGGQS